MNKAFALIAFLLVVAVSNTTSARPYRVESPLRAPKDSLDCVPTEKRERLRTRLAEFVRCEAAEDYRSAFAYLAENYKSSVVGGLTISIYSKHPPTTRLLRFSPSACVEIASDYYTIEGCGEYDRFGPNLRVESAVDAVYERGDWYFSDINYMLPCMHCEPRACR